MARPLRIEYPGAYYHVTARGNEGKAIFRDVLGRKKFLVILSSSSEQFVVRLHGYVLILMGVRSIMGVIMGVRSMDSCFLFNQTIK